MQRWFVSHSSREEGRAPLRRAAGRSKGLKELEHGPQSPRPERRGRWRRPPRPGSSGPHGLRSPRGGQKPSLPIKPLLICAGLTGLTRKGGPGEPRKRTLTSPSEATSSTRDLPLPRLSSPPPPMFSDIGANLAFPFPLSTRKAPGRTESSALSQAHHAPPLWSPGGPPAASSPSLTAASSSSRLPQARGARGLPAILNACSLSHQMLIRGARASTAEEEPIVPCGTLGPRLSSWWGSLGLLDGVGRPPFSRWPL